MHYYIIIQKGRTVVALNLAARTKYSLGENFFTAAGIIMDPVDAGT